MSCLFVVVRVAVCQQTSEQNTGWLNNITILYIYI